MEEMNKKVQAGSAIVPLPQWTVLLLVIFILSLFVTGSLKNHRTKSNVK